MLSFQWFPIKEHMFWLFSIFQLVFHLASIGFFMFFFFLFLLAGAEALHISGLAACCHASVEADLPGTGSRWGTAATWMMGDLAALKRASRVFTKNHGGFVFFFLNAEKTPKRGPWNGYLCFSIFRNRVFRQDQWWSSKKWRFGRFFAFLVGRWDGRTANHDHGDIWGLAACPNLDC